VSEVRQFLSQLPHKGLLAALVAAWILLFQFLGNSSFGYIATPSLFRWLDAVYGANPDDAIGYLIPGLIVVLIYLKRDEFGPLEKSPWAPALGLLGVALLIHFVGYLVQQARLSIVAFAFGLYSLTGLLWGPAWLRRAIFPFSLLVFCVPLTAYTDVITFPLRLVATKVAVGFCDLVLKLNLVRKGTLVFHAQADGSTGFEFDVAAACSGIRSLTVVFLLTALFGYLQFQSTRRRVLLLIAAIPLALLGNILRLITVFTVGEALGQEAGSRIESRLGFVTFLVALGGVLLIGRWLREAPADSASATSLVNPEPKAP
jgi:exosortase